MDTYQALKRDRDRRLTGFEDAEAFSTSAAASTAGSGGGPRDIREDATTGGSGAAAADGGAVGSSTKTGGAGGLWSQLSWPERRMMVELTAAVSCGYVTYVCLEERAR